MKNIRLLLSVFRSSISLPDGIVLCYRPHPKDGEGNVFSLSTPWGGVGGTSVRSRRGVPHPGQDGGVPWPGCGTPRNGVSSPSRDGVHLPEMGYPLLARDAGYPQSRDEVPPIQGWGAPQDRTADGILDLWWMLCLLHSSRRTFLYYYCVCSPNCIVDFSVPTIMFEPFWLHEFLKFYQ